MRDRRRTARIFLDFIEDGRVSMENYAEELSRELVRQSADRFALDHFRPRYRVLPGVPREWNDRLARYVSYPGQVRGEGCDVNHIIDHGYAHLLGRLPADRTVVTVHDIIPFLASIGKIPGAIPRRPWLGNYSLGHFKRARALIAVSENTKRDLVTQLQVDASRVHVAHNGLSADFRPLGGSTQELRASIGLPAEGSLVLITGRQFYKNHPTSIRVFSQLRKRGAQVQPRLVCLGRLTPEARTLARDLGVEDGVIELRAPDREALVRLYNAVDCLLFPSLYEGFGWPPLEAMACGVPVVCSRAGALPEVAGDAALLVDALDVRGFVEGILAVLSAGNQRIEARDRGLKHASRFTWRAHAEKVLQVYDAI